jgi:hypothetical protein
VPIDLIDPIPLGLVEDARFECFSMEVVQFDVVESAPPFVCDRHVVILDTFSGLLRPAPRFHKKPAIRRTWADRGI